MTMTTKLGAVVALSDSDVGLLGGRPNPGRQPPTSDAACRLAVDEMKKILLGGTWNYSVHRE